MQAVTPIAVLVWTCVAVFVSSAVITLLALVGVLQLGGGGPVNHNYYLNRLFAALVIEVIAIAVAVFYQQTQTPQLSAIPDQLVGVQKRVDQLQARVDQLQAKPASGPKWQLSRVGGDCPGQDVAQTQGAEPDNANCTATNVTAVCWDGALFRNGTQAWCTYKRVEPDKCVGGGAPGRLFRCLP